MSGSFGKLLMLLVGDQRTVDIFRFFPSKCMIQTGILRCGGEIFITSYHMGDSHQMIVDDIGKIVGWVSVGFDQDHIVQLFIWLGDITVNLIVESGFAFIRNVGADHKWFARCQIGFNLFLGQVEAVLVIGTDLLAAHNLLQRIQTFLIAEAIVSLPFFNQLFGIFHIKAGSTTLTLNIRTVSAILVRALIVL